METDVRDEWFCHSVEETIVNNDDERCDDVIALRKFGVSYIVFTNLIVFRTSSGVFFVAFYLSSKIIRKLIDSISSIMFVSDPETTLTILVIAETRKCSINIVSSSSVKIGWFIKVLPCVISFFLVFDF